MLSFETSRHLSITGSFTKPENKGLNSKGVSLSLFFIVVVVSWKTTKINNGPLYPSSNKSKLKKRRNA